MRPSISECRGYRTAHSQELMPRDLIRVSLVQMQL